MGFDCIDGELHTFGYFRVGKFVAHFHQADFTLLGRQLVQGLIEQRHHFFLLQILYQCIFILGDALRYLIILGNCIVFITDYVQNMILRHRHEVILQADAYAKLRTELPETRKDMLHRILRHSLVHQVAIGQHIKQFVVLIIDHSECFHISPLYLGEKSFIIHIRCQ